jgi:hypothetical protein
LVECASDIVLGGVEDSTRGDLDERYDMKFWRSIWRTGDGWRRAEGNETTSRDVGGLFQPVRRLKSVENRLQIEEEEL